MNGPRCARCGEAFELRQPDDRYCPRCVRETAQPAPGDRWVAPWLRRLQARDQTGLIGTGQPL